jgi:hypothetical protein
VVGKNANLVSGSGSAYTGLSGWKLAANTIGTGATLQLNIVGFLPEADNVPGSANAKLLVRRSTSTEGNLRPRASNLSPQFKEPPDGLCDHPL